MQHTFQVKSANLNTDFIRSVKSIFGDKELKITVEEVEKENPVFSKELIDEALSLIGRSKDLKVDPNLDLSRLADEVNI